MKWRMDVAFHGDSSLLTITLFLKLKSAIVNKALFLMRFFPYFSGIALDLPNLNHSKVKINLG